MLRRRPTSRAIGVVAAACLSLLLAIPLLTPDATATPAPGSGPTLLGNATRVDYLSSVDKFPLSFYEWLPSHYAPKDPTPLVVFLHGLGPGTTPVRGGVGGNSMPASFIDNASRFGAILISLNTRTEGGFYANTPCGGPQEQDALDAIAAEKARRAVSAVYLVGFSMGALGALELAGHHPGLVQGLGLAAPITDLFEELGYAATRHAIPYPYVVDLCGHLPGPNSPRAVAITTYLSLLRFHPTAFATIPIYVTSGALDRTAPSNFSLWPFSQVNSTFVNSTCHAARAMGEPPNCTTTLWELARRPNSTVVFHYVYEAGAWHSVQQLNPADLFRFFFVRTAPGFYSANFPPTVFRPLPAPP